MMHSMNNEIHHPFLPPTASHSSQEIIYQLRFLDNLFFALPCIQMIYYRYIHSREGGKMVVLLLNFRRFFVEQHTKPCTYLESSLLHYYLYDGFLQLQYLGHNLFGIFSKNLQHSMKLLFFQVNIAQINVDKNGFIKENSFFYTLSNLFMNHMIAQEYSNLTKPESRLWLCQCIMVTMNQ